MAANLPLDIIFHILTRLPAKSPLRFRCVSKSLLFSSSWSTMDLCPAVADNHPSPLPVYNADHEAKNDAKAAEVDYPLKNSGFDQVPFIGSCNGLMCVRPDPDTVLLFNPSIKDVLRSLLFVKKIYAHKLFGEYPCILLWRHIMISG